MPSTCAVLRAHMCGARAPLSPLPSLFSSSPPRHHQMSKLLSSTASFETLPPPYPGLVDNPIYLIQKYSTHSRPLDLRLDAQLRKNAGIGSARQSATVTDLKDLKQLFRFGEKQNGQQGEFTRRTMKSKSRPSVDINGFFFSCLSLQWSTIQKGMNSYF